MKAQATRRWNPGDGEPATEQEEEPDESVGAEGIPPDVSTVPCPECAGDTVTEGDEMYCVECGLVIDEDRIDRGPEWRGKTEEQATQVIRCNGAGIDPTYHDKKLGTQIAYSKDTDRSLHRQRRLHKQSKTSSKTERTLRYAFGEVKRVVSALSLPRAINERACDLYRKAHEAGLHEGTAIERVIGAVVYAACREYDTPRLVEDVAEAARIDLLPVAEWSDKDAKQLLWPTYKRVCSELGVQYEPVDPALYLPQAASELQMSEKAVHDAQRLVEFAIDQNLHVGRAPTGIAAGALYFASQRVGRQKSQEAVSEQLEVSEVTLRNRYQELAEAEGVPTPHTSQADERDSEDEGDDSTKSPSPDHSSDEQPTDADESSHEETIRSENESSTVPTEGADTSADGDSKTADSPDLPAGQSKIDNWVAC